MILLLGLRRATAGLAIAAIGSCFHQCRLSTSFGSGSDGLANEIKQVLGLEVILLASGKATQA